MTSKITFKSLIDIVRVFPDEKTCHLYLAEQRWNTGEIICPFDGCGHNTCYIYKDGIRYKCKQCKKVFTAKTGTFMEASKLPTVKWIMAMWLIMHKKGISSVQLAKDITVQQRTAWFILQRLRWALGNDVDQQPLQGTVEVDEAFVGGKNSNRHYSKRIKYKEVTGRTYPDKMPVIGFYERDTKRIRALAISRKQFSHIPRTITQHVWPGSTLMTDDWMGYRGVDKMYKRHFIAHSKWKYAEGEVTTNRIENFWSHLKRGLHGTYIKVSAKHLNKYVQEFVFRFNHRTLDTQGQINGVIRLMECRLKYKELIKKND